MNESPHMAREWGEGEGVRDWRQQQSPLVMLYKSAIQTSLPDKCPWGFLLPPAFSESCSMSQRPAYLTLPPNQNVHISIWKWCHSWGPRARWMLWMSLPSSGDSRPWQKLFPLLKISYWIQVLPASTLKLQISSLKPRQSQSPTLSPPTLCQQHSLSSSTLSSSWFLMASAISLSLWPLLAKNFTLYSSQDTWPKKRSLCQDI